MQSDFSLSAVRCFFFGIGKQWPRSHVVASENSESGIRMISLRFSTE